MQTSGRIARGCRNERAGSPSRTLIFEIQACKGPILNRQGPATTHNILSLSPQQKEPDQLFRTSPAKHKSTSAAHFVVLGW
jgi:hypothetical protein